MQEWKNRVFLNFIIVLTSFLLGLWISHIFYTQKLAHKDIETRFLGTSYNLDMQEFWDVYQLIWDEFFSQDGVKKQDLVYGAIEWMVAALWDEHSEFFSPSATEKFHTSLSWDFEGIGAVVEKVPLWVKIERIFKGSPAKKYGLFSGDILISANGESLVGLDIFDAVEKIKGPAGSEVILEILRVWESDIIERTVVRDKIHIPSVEIEEIWEDVLYISLNMFGDSSVEEFWEAISLAISSQKQGLIIDLRDNGWWYLDSAVSILSYFIDTGEVLVETRYRKSFLGKTYTSQKNDQKYTGKIVVLINRNSASASEIVAWALREYHKAILVGEKSFGKGSVQEAYNLVSQSLLKLTVAQWFTPQGKNIEDEGIQPDIEVFFEWEDFENDYDRQLEEAKKVLRMFQVENTLWLTLEKYHEENSKEE